MADSPHAHEATAAAAPPHAHASPQAPPQTHAHAHAGKRKVYWIVFGALFALTVLEVAIAAPQLGVPRTPMVLGLISMALAKAGLVALFFMHLRDEFSTLRLGVLIPFLFPAIYALILVFEAAWRLVR